MNSIHTHAQLTPSCDLGSQNYEQWIVETERKGRCRKQCIIHCIFI